MAAMMGDVADYFARGGEFAEARILEQPDDAALMFRSVHPELLDSELFLAAAWFNRSLTRVAQGVVASGDNAPLPLQPRLWLSAAEQSINWRSFLSLDAGDWRHPVPWDTRVLVSKSITAGREWAYVVIHEQAGEWLCMDGHEFTTDDFELVPLFAILEVDPSVAEILELAPGERAWRDGAGRCPGSASATRRASARAERQLSEGRSSAAPPQQDFSFASSSSRQ